MRRSVVGLGCLLLALLALWVVMERRRSERQGTPVDSGIQAVEPVESEKPGVAIATVLDGRIADVESRIEGRVISSVSSAMAGARIVLVPLPAPGMEPKNREEINDIEARSSADGTFAFDAPPDLSSGGVLLAWLDGYSRGGADLPVLAAGQSHFVEIRLEPAEPVDVTVIEPQGHRAAGARVHHALSIDAMAHSSLQWPRFLADVVVTGADGIVRLPALIGEQEFYAEKGALVSVPWRGENPSAVTLRLGDQFTLEGTVTWPSRSMAPDGEGRIRVFGQTGNLWRPLATLEGIGEGAWGPLAVPLSGIASYRVRLEGGSVRPVEEAFAPPPSGTRRRVDLVAAFGFDLEIAVHDDAGASVNTARCLAWWSQSGQPDDVHISRGARLGSGVYRVSGLSEGWVQYRVEAPGFALHEYWAEIPQVEPIEVELQRGGRIVGRCMHAGDPVTDFEVIYWREGNPRVDQRKSFFGREDGRFEIDHLSPGGWFVQAASPAHPCGLPTGVRVDARDTAEVEIELPTALAGGGRVLDAETGDAIAGALVQAFSSGGLERSFEWGPPAVTDEEGSFDLSAFVAGANYIRVDAEGFASAYMKANAQPDGFLDWGDVRLQRPQRLHLALLGLDEVHSLNPSELRAGTVDGHILPQKAFGPDGIVEFEGVPPGAHRLFVYFPDNSWARLQLQLEPGRDWDIDFKVGGERTLDVIVLDARGEPLPFRPQVMVVAQEESGILVVRLAVAYEDGSMSFAGIRADDVQVWIYDWEQRTIASREVDLVATAGQRIEIRLDQTPLRVRVVDSEDAPISAAAVSIRSVSGDEILGAQRTDTDGWASFFGLPRETVLMDVDHGIFGRRFGVHVDARLDEVVFVLEADGALEVEVRDGDELLAGVRIGMQTESGVPLGERKQTSDDGRARFEPVGEGSYHIACNRADAWPVTVNRTLAPGEHAVVPVEMRRLGDLQLIVTNAAGLPISGIGLDLVPTDIDGEIARWIDEERVRAPSGLATDLRGVLRIDGLPRGAYAWSIQAASGPISGRFELRPVHENTVRVQLPD